MRSDTRDTLNRRKRFAPPQPTGEPVFPREVGLETFRALDDGPLSIDQLFTWLNIHIGLQNRIGYGLRLRKFYNEDNAPHGGQYVYKPWGQKETEYPSYQALVYANTIRAWRYMEVAGVSEHRPSERFHEIDDFWHAYMVSSILFSIKLACKEKGLRYIPRREIVGSKALSIKAPITFEDKYYDGFLQPDGVFAVEYPGGGRRYFFLEADRDSEGVDLTDLTKKSYRRKLLQYNEVLRGKLYKEFLGIEAAPVRVLHVTTNEAHMQTMIKSLLKITKDAGSPSHCFRLDPHFSLRRPEIPKPSAAHGNELWRRAGREPINILDL
jgi:hypothetical protein